MKYCCYFRTENINIIQIMFVNKCQKLHYDLWSNVQLSFQLQTLTFRLSSKKREYSVCNLHFLQFMASGILTGYR